MRNIHHMFLALTCVLALGATGCGDDGDDDDDDDDDDIVDAAGPDIDGGGGGEAPVIDSVTWTAAVDCEEGTAGPYDITVAVTDADTSVDALTITGSVSSCTGQINSDSVTINCPNAASYPGSVTVADPEGNEDTVNFTISPCVDGSAP